MDVFPLATPPEDPGVYALYHPPSKTYYVGSSVNLWRRWCEWKSSFSTGIYIKNHAIAQVAANIADWKYVVVLVCPLDEIREKEIEAYTELRNTPGVTVLNNEDMQRRYEARNNPAKSVITDDAGQQISGREAAQRIGCKLNTLRKRMKEYRKKGHSGEFSLEFLISTSTIRR